MKKLFVILIITGLFVHYACEKDDPSPRFIMLTTPVWISDSLLVNGVDASGPGEMLAEFKGEAIFHKNGTGVFGKYLGTWRLAQDDQEIVISSDSLVIRTLTANIDELTEKSLKITTGFPNFDNPAAPFYIRMTFNAE